VAAGALLGWGARLWRAHPRWGREGAAWAYCEPSGLSNVTLPPSDDVRFDIARVNAESGLPPTSPVAINSPIRNRDAAEERVASRCR
jgi:hypothetical protein